jgi:hypothetical protein
MWWTKGWVAGGLALVAVWGGLLQLAPGPVRTNPPVTASHTLQGVTQVPGHVDALLKRACMDCHSNETRWPWYSRLPLMSWAVVNDVTRARKVLNLSEWTTGAGLRPASAVGVLTAMCAGVQQDRMPLPKYRILHPQARLTADDKEALCAWTVVETNRQLDRKRKTLVTQNVH